jgi:cytochrome P450
MVAAQIHLLRNAPGPRGSLIWGSLPELMKGPHAFYSRMRDEYGDVVRLRSFPTFFWHLVSHPSGVEQVLQTNQQNYQKGRLFNKPVGLLTGNGLVTSEGEFWRRQRRLVQPAFHRQVVSSYARAATSAAEDMLKRWDAYAKSGEHFDVAEEMTHLTLRIAGRALFNVDLGERSSEFGGALRVVLEHINFRMLNAFALPEFIPTSRNKRFNKAKRFLDDVVYGIIAASRKQSTDTGDLLSMLMMAKDEETGEGMTDEQLRDEVMTLLVGGHETGAAALAWTWYLLAKHPEEAGRLRAELDEVLKGRTPTFEDLHNLPYTKMVFDEVLRLYPPAWGQIREAIDEDEISGFRIPAKSIVVVSQYVTHRHPDFWDEPDRFMPERFLPGNMASRPRFAYYPFGGGARKCVGNSFALMEAQLVIATVARRYIPRLEPGRRVEMDPTFTLRPLNGLRVTLRD